MTFPPAIILVRPQMGENIGAAARAMMNFGLADLRIVAPRDGWPNDKAVSMAAHATGILNNARLTDTFAEATADLQYLYATSARGRDMIKPVLDPRPAMEQASRQSREGVRVGLVFGPERTGLANEEVALSDTLINVPTNPGNASLNLAQTVVILAYEWFQANLGTGASGRQASSAKASPINPDKLPIPATRQEIDGFFGHLEQLLNDHQFFKTPEVKPHMWRGIRGLFIRAGLSGQDVRTLRGMIRSLTEPR